MKKQYKNRNRQLSRKLAYGTLFTAAMLAGHAAEAQFSSSGGSTTTMDNVAIGSTGAPGSKLYVTSGYGIGGGCSTWTGQPALKVDWNIPTYGCTPGPAGSPPNAIEVLGVSTFGGGSPSFAPLMTMNATGQMGISTFPDPAFTLFNNGHSKLKGNLQVGDIPLPSGSRMVVDGDLTLTNANPAAWRSITARSTTGALQLAANTNSQNGSSIELFGPSSSGTEGQIRFMFYGGPGRTGIDFINYNPGTSSWDSKLRISTDGKVAIGPGTMTTPGNYRLYVDDGILTKRIKVALPSDPSNWADFVFAPDYKLMPLSEVEEFIEANSHLPEIPSTAEVHQEGLDLAQMDAKLLQKIEELTLHLIAQEKQITELKKQVSQIKK